MAADEVGEIQDPGTGEHGQMVQRAQSVAESKGHEASEEPCKISRTTGSLMLHIPWQFLE
jgi:hypothetical protein